jgi:exonuclease SbcD
MCKLLHIADLHIGKRVNEFSMLEDQKYILQDILRLVDEVKPAVILIAGDVYDKSVPSGEAVEVLDDFLTDLAARRLQIFIVSGNHDSPERLDFGSRIMVKNGIHIAGTFDGFLKIITLQDEYGPVNIYLLPFIKPAMVQPHFADQSIESYEDAVRVTIQAAQVDCGERNILAAHQFITSGALQPERSDSETVAVGGLDNIDASVFEPFDYVALGHLHGPQSIGRETIRYSGSPLKYSFSEVRQQKSVTLIEFAQKGTINIQTLSLTALRDMREIKGPLAELLRAGLSAGTLMGTSTGIAAGTSMRDSTDTSVDGAVPSVCQDFIRAILTDEDEIYDAIGQLRQVYPNIMRLDFENSRIRQVTDSTSAAAGDVARKSPLELFAEFYLKQNNCELNEEQQRIIREILEQVGGANR